MLLSNGHARGVVPPCFNTNFTFSDLICHPIYFILIHTDEGHGGWGLIERQNFLWSIRYKYPVSVPVSIFIRFNEIWFS